MKLSGELTIRKWLSCSITPDTEGQLVENKIFRHEKKVQWRSESKISRYPDEGDRQENDFL
jgi:hypothetical protein